MGKIQEWKNRRYRHHGTKKTKLMGPVPNIDSTSTQIS